MPTQLQPNDFLWPYYRPREAPLAFRAADARAARAWRTRTRTQLAQAIGFQGMPRMRPTSRLLERVERGDVVREKHLLQTSTHSRMQMCIRDSR